MLCRRTFVASVALSISLLAGCSGSSGTGGGEGQGGTPTAKEALTDLVALLKHFDETKRKPPTRLAEVEPVEPLFPGAFIGLTNGTIVYYWGAPLDAGGSSTVLAYEKKVETDGGWVLMQDGTIKEMKSPDFRNAPKAKK
jgi:hypothetical protein